MYTESQISELNKSLQYRYSRGSIKRHEILIILLVLEKEKKISVDSIIHILLSVLKVPQEILSLIESTPMNDNLMKEILEKLKV